MISSPSIKLISITKPEIDGVENAEDLIAYCARVSNPQNQNNKKTAQRLLTYLRKENHWSPFEMVSACLEITSTRDIIRQILRHRSFSFQEFSQRYAEVDSSNISNFRDPRLQDTKNRQNSIETDDVDLKMDWLKQQSQVIVAARDAYQWALKEGIAKEQARAVLPEGLTSSTIYMQGTIRSWIHYIDLRSSNGTQKEHQEIAIECGKVLKTKFPNIF